MKRISALILIFIINTAIAQFKPADGLWNTTDDPAIGSGLMMTTQNAITVISLFTYTATGENVWYIGSGQVDGEGVLEVDLYQTQNGQNLLGDNPQSASIFDEFDTLKIVFLGSNKANLQFNGSVAKTITPIHFGHDTSYGFPGLSGRWAVAD